MNCAFLCASSAFLGVSAVRIGRTYTAETPRNAEEAQRKVLPIVSEVLCVPNKE
jgi:hypothetical protein